jgi:hypothetical protein
VLFSPRLPPPVRGGGPPPPPPTPKKSPLCLARTTGQAKG